LNHILHEEQLKNNSVFKLTKFVRNVVSGKTVVVVLDCEVLGTDLGQRIGDPQDIAAVGGGPENVPPQQQKAADAAQSMYGNKPNHNNTNSTAKPGGNAYGNRSSGFGGNNPYGGSSSSSSAPIVRTTPGGSSFTPIANLNMYQSRWTIRARVTTKSDIRTWSNARGEGSLFSIDMLDQSGIDIRATFFKEAVEKFNNMLEEGKVYTFSGGRIKVANMQYNTCKSNFEITFDQNAEIHLDNDAGDIQRNRYDFVPSIASLEQVEANKNVDLLAIVKTVGEPTTLMSKKTGNELTKCDLTLVDDSGAEINLTLWGPEKANVARDTYANNPVVAFRRVRVSDFGGKSLSLSGGADIRPVNDCPEDVHRLEQWWSNGGSSSSGTKKLSSTGGIGGGVAPFSERLDIADIKGKHLGHGEKPDWLTFKGTISFIKKDKEGGAWYPACPNANDPCKNMFKVSQNTDGSWFCDKCQGTFPEPVRRFIFSATVEDDTSSTWVSFFNAQGETLLGGETTADQAYERFMAHNGDQDGYDSLFFKALYTEWVFKCKVKSELVNEEQRVKTSVYALQPLDYVQESHDMLAAIQKWT